jgi:WD40 repeat protein
MYVPSLANKPSGEAGHPNYQHPTRAETRAYSPDLDRFPHLVIATALKGLAVLGPTLWERFDSGDNLLFVEDDFREPAKSPLLRTLWDSGDVALQSLVGRLAVACTKPIPQTPWLDQIAPDGQPLPLDAQTTQAALAALGRSAPAAAGGPVNPPQPSPTAGAEAFAGLGDEPQSARPAKGSRGLGTRALEPEFLDPEPATSARKTGTRKIGTRTQEPHKGKKSPALIIAAVIGLGGAGVGGFLLFGGKKPVETADSSKTEDSKADRPSPPAAITPVNTSATKTAPTPRAPVKAPPTPPPDPTPPTDAPKLEAPGEVLGPKADPMPLDPLELKPRWKVPGEAFGDSASFDPSTETVYFGDSALDLRTGATRPGFRVFQGRASWMLLDHGRVASFASNERVIQVWESKTGQLVRDMSEIAVPIVVPGKFQTLLLSPNGRYLAVTYMGQTGSGQPPETPPFHVYDVSTGTLLLKTTWTRGSFRFTADSSRLLVAEEQGRFRWFKIPSCQPDGEWSLPAPSGRPHRITAMSADGSVLGYTGNLEGKLVPSTLLLEGRSGQVLYDCKGYSGRNIRISADGRLILVLDRLTQTETVFVVKDVATGAIIAKMPIAREPVQGSLIAFSLSPDGRHVCINLSESKLTLLYDIPPVGGALAVNAPAAKPAPVPNPAPNLDPKPRDPLAMKLRWKIPCEVREDSELTIDPANHLVYLGSTAQDLQTGEVRQGFTKAVIRPKWFPLDQGRVATFDLHNAIIQVWDSKTGKLNLDKPQIPIPHNNDDRTYTVNLSPNGRYLVVTYASRSPQGQLSEIPQLYVYDVGTNTLLLKTEMTGGSSHFTADSSRLLVAEKQGRFRWFKIPSGQPDGEWSFPPPRPGQHHHVTSMSADGKILGYTGCLDRSLHLLQYILDGTNGKVLLAGGGYSFTPISLSADGRLALIWGERTPTESLFVVKDVRTGAIVAQLKTPGDEKGAGFTFCLSPDGRQVCLYDVRERKTALYDLPVGGLVAKAPAQNPNPKLDENPGPKPNPDLKPLDPVDLKPRWTVDADGAWDTRLVIDPATECVVCGSTVFNLRTGKIRPGFEGVRQNSRIHWFPLDRGRIASYCDGETSIRVWAARTGQPAPKTPLMVLPEANQSPIVTLSPNGRYLAITTSPNRDGSGKPVGTVAFSVYDTMSMKLLFKTTMSNGSSYFTGDSLRLLVAENEGRFRWFKLPSGQPDGGWSFPPPKLQVHLAITGMSADGGVIEYHGEGTGKEFGGYGIYLLDGKSGQVLFHPKMSRDWPLRISGDGRIAAFWSRRVQTEDIFEIVDVSTGAVVARAQVPCIPMVGGHIFELSPDGRHFAVFYEKKLHLFDLPGGGAAIPGVPIPVDPAVVRAPAAPAVVRVAVPAEDAVAKALKDVRDAFKDDYARKQPAEKKALAQKLLTTAEETADDPASRYALLREAADIAMQLGDPALAIQATDSLARLYDVDGPALRATTLEKLLAAATGPTALRPIFDVASIAATAAFEAGDYAAAARSAAIAGTAARKGNLGPSATQDADLLSAQARKWAEGLAAVKPALAALNSAPDDPEANLTLGRYRCFVQGKWEEGLKNLAKGSLPGLKAAAEADLAAQAAKPDLKVADAWHDYAKTAPEPEKWAADSRARYWDVRVATVLTGLAKVKVESRIGLTAGGIEYKPGLAAEFQIRQGAVTKPKTNRIDPTLDFSPSAFSDPNTGKADVIGKWVGAIAPPRGGLYKLVAETNDPVKIRVDSKIIIDTISKGGNRTEATVLLAERPTKIEVEYSGPNATGHTLKLKWSTYGGDEELIPAECLFHDRKAEGGSGK